MLYQFLNGPIDLAAVLSLVDKGTARFLSIGRAEITYVLTEENKWQSVEIELRHVGVQFKAGNQIRLELTGSAFPLFSRHPNGTFENIHRIGIDGLKIATVAISASQAFSSWLNLPVRLQSPKE